MNKRHLKEIGERLRNKRYQLKLTREKIAELSDISPRYYANLETGTSQMSIDTLIKLSKSLHISTEYILFGDNEKKGNPNAVLELLSNCTEREIKLTEEIIKLFLLKN